jgi:hypothetical protein
MQGFLKYEEKKFAIIWSNLYFFRIRGPIWNQALKVSCVGPEIRNIPNWT